RKPCASWGVVCRSCCRDEPFARTLEADKLQSLDAERPDSLVVGAPAGVGNLHSLVRSSLQVAGHQFPATRFIGALPEMSDHKSRVADAPRVDRPRTQVCRG